MSAFRFKQFSVAHEHCAMKVNTDGVLLGAWADVSQADTMLDIGTGTGVIALMLAQRNERAVTDAIDIDAHAYLQAKENFEQSPWSARLRAVHSSLQEFAGTSPYDVIISNPPYFVADFKTSDHQRNVARHSLALSYEELVHGISRLLSEAGNAFLVVPYFNYPMMERIALEQRLFVVALTEVVAVQGKKPYLALLQLGRQKREASSSRLEIQDANGNFTPAYTSLTKEFYLKF